MLNDLELIQHWHLRDVVTWLTLAIGALFLTAVILATVALTFEAKLLWMIAAGDVAAACLLACPLARAWRRLDELEAMIP